MPKCNLFKTKLIFKIMILRSHKKHNNKVIINSEPIIKYYFFK